MTTYALQKKRAMLQELGFRLTGMRVVQVDADFKMSQEDCKEWTTQQILQGQWKKRVIIMIENK